MFQAAHDIIVGAMLSWDSPPPEWEQTPPSVFSLCSRLALVDLFVGIIDAWDDVVFLRRKQLFAYLEPSKPRCWQSGITRIHFQKLSF